VPSGRHETQIRRTQDLCNTARTVDKEQQVTHTGDDQTCHEVIAHAVSPLGAAFVNDLDPSALAGVKDTVSRLEWVPTGFAVLVVKRGPNTGSRFRLDHPVTSAGRHPDSNIFLDDITVSRRHAEFRRETGEFRVVDVGSLNGTYLNGEPIGSAVLTDGDEIDMGKFRLVFLIGPATS
jgi:pSer/pThr/pTyr-binding forkhead associated (FHA) protein